MDISNWFLTTTLLGLPIRSWALAAGGALLAYVVMTTLLRLARGRLAGSTDAPPSELRLILAEVLARTGRPLLVVVALLVGLNLVELPDRWSLRVAHLWYATVALQLALWGAKLIELLMKRQLQRQAAPGTTPQATVASTLIGWGLNILLWTVVLLAILSNLGFNITAFVASLGIGGIAIALAAQNVLGDLFASISIALDKPFEVGDAINNGSFTGTVMHVGMKTTRIRALSGEQIVVSNTELLKSTLRNFKRMETRRIEFTVGVTYDTTPDQAEEIPRVIRRVVEAQPQVKFDRAHFARFGDSSLDYVVIYIVQTPDYLVYMDSQQAINLALMREFAAMGVEFAFPTRTVVLSGLPAGLTDSVK